MTLSSEAEATEWLFASYSPVSRETWTRLAAFKEYLVAENKRQNLISRGTISDFHLRHVADSAQLLQFAYPGLSTWIDLGSGAGFPGLIVALLSDYRVTLVESRKLRVDFLNRAADVLGVTSRVTIVGSPLERLDPIPHDVISARAFAPLPKLLNLAHPFSTEKTRWILPKGRSAQTELEDARVTWQGDFRIEPSLTSPDAGIIVAERVKPKRKR